jgi:protein TonB
MKNGTMGSALLLSFLLHLTVISFVSTAINKRSLRRDELFPIRLIELSRPEKPPPIQTVQATEPVRETPPPTRRRVPRSEGVKSPIAPPQIASALEPPPVRETPAPKPETPPASAAPVETLPAPLKKDPSEAAQSAAAPTALETQPTASWPSRGEGGGSDAGGGSESGTGAVALAPGTGAGSGGGGTAPSGLGRGSGAPGLPAETRPIRTNRQARPVQTVRAHYPPMALRAGVESDVTLKIEVDVDGKVTNAEIVKSGGAGFDEEALKAVKQSRFEPAQRDGYKVPAEFTFVYRFRLQR